MSTNDPDLNRKIAERYGNAPYNLVGMFEVPNAIEGGDGVGATIQFDNNGKVTTYLRTRGLWQESDAPTLETYYAKLTEIPPLVSATIQALNAQKHGVPLAPIPSDGYAASVAELSAIKHAAYLRDPTPPDPSPDILDDGERNADMSPL